MATIRLSLDDIEEQVLHITGYSASTTAPWTTAANLYQKINYNAQKIPQKVALVAKAEGKHGWMGIPMWYTTAAATTSAAVGNFVVVSASSDLLFPDDMDKVVSIHDTTNDRQLEQIFNYGQERYRMLRDKVAGPPQFYEITGTTGVRRNGRLLPDTAASTVPALRLIYYRTPAIMPGSSPGAEFPDGDNKWHYLWVLETVLEILRPDDAAYTRYQELESEMIVELAATGFNG